MYGIIKIVSCFNWLPWTCARSSQQQKQFICFNWLPWTSIRISYWEMLPEMNLNQKTLKLYTSWVHWKNKCRSTRRMDPLFKHEYQHSGDIFVKNIFKPFHDTNLFADLLFLTLLVTSSFSWSMHNLLLSCVICFWFCFGCIDCSLYTKKWCDWG